MKRWLLTILILLVAGGGYIVWTRFFPSHNVLSVEEKKQAMEDILDRQVVTEEKGPQQWKTYSGKYLAFSYPADCTIHKKNPPRIISEAFTCSLTMPRRNLTIQVSEARTFEDSPAVVVRRKQQEDYQEDSRKIGKYEGIVFTKDKPDGVEQTGFFLVDGKLYSIAVTGSQVDSVKELYDKVVATAEVK